MAEAYENPRPEQRASEWVVMPKPASPSGKIRMRRPAHPRRAFGFSAGLGRGRSFAPSSVASGSPETPWRRQGTAQHWASSNKCLGRSGRSRILGSGLEYGVPCERLGVRYYLSGSPVIHTPDQTSSPGTHPPVLDQHHNTAPPRHAQVGIVAVAPSACVGRLICK